MHRKILSQFQNLKDSTFNPLNTATFLSPFLIGQWQWLTELKSQLWYSFENISPDLFQ